MGGFKDWLSERSQGEPEREAAGFGGFLDRRENESERQRAGSLEAASRTDPARERRARQAADKTGIPAGTAARNPDDADRAARRADVERALDGRPRTAEIASDPERSRVAFDDLTILGQIEETINIYNAAGKGLRDAARAPAQFVDSLDERRADSEITRGEDLQRRAVQGFASVPRGALEGVAVLDRSIVSERGEQSEAFLPQLREKAATARAALDSGEFRGRPLTGGGRELLRSQLSQAEEQIAQHRLRIVQARNFPDFDEQPLVQRAAEIEAWITGGDEPDPAFDEDFVAKLTTGAGNLGAFLLLGVTTGPFGVAAAGAGMESSGQYREALHNGATEEDALRAAGLGALIGTTEVLPIMTALKRAEKLFPGARSRMVAALAKTARSGSEEAAQEALQGVLSNMTAAGIYDPERGILDGVGEQALIGGILGTGMGAGVTGVQETVTSLRGRGRRRRDERVEKVRAAAENVLRAQRADAGKRMIDGVAKAARESRVRADLPDEFRTWVSRLTGDENGDTTTLYIDRAEFLTFFQEAIPDEDARVAFYQQAGIADQVANAEDGGGQIALPLEDYATTIAPTEYHDGLADIVRTGPGEMSAREARDFERNADSIIEEQARRIVGEGPTDEAPETPSARVGRDIETQLRGAGLTEEQARRGGALHAAHAAVLQQEYGIDPVDWYRRRFGLRIEGDARNARRPQDPTAEETPGEADGPAPAEADGGRPDEGGGDRPAGDTGGDGPREAPPAPDVAGSVETARTEPPQSEATPGGLVSVPAADIVADAETFQFKGDGDADGVTETLRGVKKWNPSFAGVSLVYEDADGGMFIVDGHQRLGLAKRLEAEGHEPISLNVELLRESDGWTKSDARVYGALKNIAEGGESTQPVDVAKVFREGANVDEVTAFIPPSRRAFRDGVSLSRLGDQAWGMVVNEVVPPQFAAEVADVLTDPAQQVAGLEYLARNAPANRTQARMVAEQIRAAGFDEGSQDTLFGAEAFAETLLIERAGVLDNAVKTLRSRKRALNTALTSEDVLVGAGNVISEEGTTDAIQQNDRLAVTVEKLATRAGPVSDALGRAARALKDGTSRKAAVDQFLGEIAELGPEAAQVAAPAGADPQVDPAPDPDGERDPDTADMFAPAPTPEIQTVAERLPKDADGVPEFARLDEEIGTHGAQSWDELRPAERGAVIDAFPEPETPPEAAEPSTGAGAAEIRRADKLATAAEKARGKAEEKRDQPRETNTAKRARQAAQSEQDARQEITRAETALAIADMQRDGTAGPLSEVATMQDVAALERARRVAIMRAAQEMERDGTATTRERDEIREGRARPPEGFGRYAPVPAIRLFAGMGKDLIAAAGREHPVAVREIRRNSETPITDPEAIDAIAALARDIKKRSAAAGKAGTLHAVDSILDDMREINRWRKMGATTRDGVAAAVEAYDDARAGDIAPDPLKAARRALVGAKIPGFFETPAALAERMVDMAGLEPGERVLEPSAGAGRIASAIKERIGAASLDVIEPVGPLREILELQGFTPIAADFTEFEGGQYDAILMNPPFEKRQDVEHVRHAYDLLAPGGRLVAIMGEGAYFGSDRKAEEFRAWIDDLGAEGERLPDGTFRESGTGVATRIIRIDKPLGDAATPAEAAQGDEFFQSAVTNDDGSPRILYHATDADFDVFDFTKLGEFTRANAGSDAPVVMAELGVWANTRDISGDTLQRRAVPLYMAIESPLDVSFADLWSMAEDYETGEGLREQLISDGYDGLAVDDTEFGGTSFVAFTSEQIRLAQSPASIFEPGAEGNPQQVVPGAERISDRELAVRRAGERMRGRTDQRAAEAQDGGLFDVNSRNQDTLFQGGNEAARMQRARALGFDIRTFYHGTPDARGVLEAGRFEPRTQRVDVVSDPAALDRLRADVDAARGGPTREFMAALDAVSDAIEKREIPAPIFLSDARSMAATYADPRRAFDFQGAEEQVFELFTRPGRALTIDAGGRSFRGVRVADVRQALADADVPAAEIDALIRHERAANRVADDVMRTDSLTFLAASLGFDSIDVTNVRDNYRGDGAPATVRMILDPRDLRSTDAAFSLSESETPLLLDQGPRGQIGFGNGETIIRLFEGADESTFLHESAHFFLQSLRAVAEDQDSTGQAAADLASLVEWFGVNDPAAIGVEQHERFARGMEAYFREGAAPTEQLRPVFARFAAWLTRIYRTVADLDVEISDGVRGVMGRLLATSDAIAREERLAAYDPMFERATDAGMSDAEYARYAEAHREASQVAAEDLLRRTAAGIKRAQRAEYRDQVERIRAAVAAEVDAMPEYKALAALAPRPDSEAPRLKLSREELVRLYGEDALKRLPRGFGTVYAREQDAKQGEMLDDAEPTSQILGIEQAGPLFGFASGDALVQAMLDLEARGARIDRVTKERAEAQIGQRPTEAEAAEQAARSVHNDARAKFLEIELRALARRTRVRIPPRKALKDAAEAAIRRQPLRGSGAAKFLMAERKAADDAITAAAEGRFSRAALEKKAQLFNHYLYMAARDAETQRGRVEDHVRRIKKASAREAIGQTEMEQIDALLVRYGLMKEPRGGVRRQQSLAQWVAQAEAEGLQVYVSEDVANEGRRQHYTRVSYGEFLDLFDAIRNIEHIGRTRTKLRIEGKRQEIEEAAELVVNEIERNHEIRPEPLDFAQSTMSRIKDNIGEFLSAHVKPEFLFERLDGFRRGGVVHRYLFQPIADAEARENDLMAEASRGIGDIFRAYSRAERLEWYTKRVHVPSVDKSFNKQALLSVALNWGNQYNRDALMDGYGWTEEQVGDILAELSAKDWQVVQRLWDFIDGYWPQIAEMQKRLAGFVPPKVEPTTVQTRHGEFRGGYYPIQFDSKLSFRAFEREEKQSVQEAFGGNFMRAQTRKGHTIARTGTGGQPVRLDLGVLTQHVTNVVHDLTHRETVMDVDRLLRRPDVRAAIEGVAGREPYRQLRPWLNGIASDFRNFRDPLEGIIGHMRTGVSIANMGFKFTTAIVQPLGYTQSIALIGERAAWRGLRRFLAHPIKSTAFVTGKSGAMRNRQRAFDRDARDAIKRAGLGSIANDVKSTFFIFTGMLDMAVSVPTWLGAYGRAMEEGADEAEAIRRGDQAVRMSQSSGGPKDLAAIQRGGEHFRALTMFYSYFSSLYNMMRRRGLIAQKEGAGGIPKLAADFLYLVAVPAVLSSLIVGRGPEDDDEFVPWAIKEAGMYPLMSMVFARDLASGVLGDYPYEFSPVASAFGDIVTSGKAVRDVVIEGDEISGAEFKNMVLSAGYMLHLPARQAHLTGEAILDWIDSGDAPSPYELLVTGVRDE